VYDKPSFEWFLLAEVNLHEISAPLRNDELVAVTSCGGANPALRRIRQAGFLES